MLHTHLTKTVMFTLAALAVMMPDMASAKGIFSTGLCAALGLITDDAGLAIATLAIITLGIGALLARVSWGMVVMICVGIIVIFSAPALVTAVGGEPC